MTLRFERRNPTAIRGPLRPRKALRNGAEWPSEMAGAGRDRHARPGRTGSTIVFLAAQLFPGLRVYKQLHEFGVEMPILDLETKDVDGFCGGDSALVGSITRGQSIEYIGDTHHLRLERDLF